MDRFERVRFEKCCFCIELRLGALLIGYFGVITCVIMIPLTILIIAADKEMGTGATIVEVIKLPLTIVALVIHVILIIGIKKDKLDYIKIFLMAFAAFIVVMLIVDFIQLIVTKDLWDFIFGLLCTIFAVYLLLVVRSYYLRELARTATIPTPIPSPRK